MVSQRYYCLQQAFLGQILVRSSILFRNNRANKLWIINYSWGVITKEEKEWQTSASSLTTVLRQNSTVDESVNKIEQCISQNYFA